jgi:hypothetical protein
MHVTVFWRMHVTVVLASLYTWLQVAHCSNSIQGAQHWLEVILGAKMSLLQHARQPYVIDTLTAMPDWIVSSMEDLCTILWVDLSSYIHSSTLYRSEDWKLVGTAAQVKDWMVDRPLQGTHMNLCSVVAIYFCLQIFSLWLRMACMTLMIYFSGREC